MTRAACEECWSHKQKKIHLGIHVLQFSYGYVIRDSNVCNGHVGLTTIERQLFNRVIPHAEKILSVSQNDIQTGKEVFPLGYTDILLCYVYIIWFITDDVVKMKDHEPATQVTNEIHRDVSESKDPLPAGVIRREVEVAHWRVDMVEKVGFQMFVPELLGW